VRQPASGTTLRRRPSESRIVSSSQRNSTFTPTRSTTTRQRQPSVFGSGSKPARSSARSSAEPSVGLARTETCRDTGRPCAG
jgi:hypothetical protein